LNKSRFAAALVNARLIGASRMSRATLRRTPGKRYRPFTDNV
jgi:hypothetical protein